MCTAQNNDIRSGIEKRTQTCPHDPLGLRTGQDAVLDELDKTLANMFHHPDS